jgi:hypothetical protein
LAVSLLGTLLACGCASATAARATPLPSAGAPLAAPETPVAAPLPLENSRIDFGSFFIRPPANLTLVTQEGKAGDRLWTWEDESRPDGLTPMFTVAMSDPRAEGSEAFKVLQMADKVRLDPEWVLNMTLSLYGEQPDFKRTKAERGTINGRPYIRAAFTSPISEENPTLVHGFLYVFCRPELVTEIWTVAAEPGHEAFLAMAEAAVQTFEEKP